jgi:hypothetical protein
MVSKSHASVQSPVEPKMHHLPQPLAMPRKQRRQRLGISALQSFFQVVRRTG